MPAISRMLQAAQDALSSNEGARLEAEVLLAHVLQKDRGYLYTWPERELSLREQHHFMALVTQRIQGSPIAYLCGRKGFWNLELEVNHSTLIPRPETELLVELALEKLPHSACKIIDLGSGSGAIALALASERPQWTVFASDKYPGAMDLLKRNKARIGLQNVICVQSDWLEAIREQDFDLIVSNPPYIEASDEHLYCGDVRFEPRTALVSAEQGLADLRQVTLQAWTRLKPAGWLLLEHGHQQGNAVRELFAGQGYQQIETVRDLGNRERVTLGRKCSG